MQVSFPAYCIRQTVIGQTDGSQTDGGQIGRSCRSVVRSLLPWALALMIFGGPAPSVAQTETVENPKFSFIDVAVKAEAQAGGPYETQDGRVPDFLLNINYDQWRDIRFRTEKSLWRGEKLPFEVQFFHPGLFYNHTVAINEVTPEGVRPVTFSVDLFNYGANDFVNKIPPDFGFAGLRLHYPLKHDDYLDEVAVFLGASYFRAVGKGQTYGLSARGLAIDTGLDSGEEFPYFKEFWLEKPDPDAQKIVILALLDSPSVTGAYRFSIHPGDRTEMTVEVKLFQRAGSHKFGIAPLTSMFFYGETINQRPVDDFRPEVHDSDGLLVASRSGEWTWRPLVNRQHLFINSFQVHNPAGFGLMQRDRDFDHYQDQETRYDLRPSVWVEPVGDWGPGQVELVQIPSGSEKNDNIVAYWVPAQLPEGGAAMNFIYTLIWYLSADDPDGLGQVIATRSAAGKEGGTRKLIVDFKGGKLDQLPSQLPAETPLDARINVGDMGEIIEKQLYRIEPSGSWRLVFQVRRKPGTTTLAAVLPESISKPAPIELRAYLIQGETVLTETWSHAVWP